MKSEKGQSLVEFALVLPILLLLLFGIVDFGRVFHAYLTIDHAGREAARAASIGRDDGVVLDTAERFGKSINLNRDTHVNITPKGTRSSGTEVTIIINYNVNLLTPVLGSLIKDIPLTDSTIMRVE